MLKKQQKPYMKQYPQHSRKPLAQAFPRLWHQSLNRNCRPEIAKLIIQVGKNRREQYRKAKENIEEQMKDTAFFKDNFNKEYAIRYAYST